MRLFKQILIILLAILVIVAFNTSLYFVLTVKCGNNFGNDVSKNSMIEPEKYLPFTEDSEIVRLDSEFSITGELPVLDGATALLPVYSAFANAVYPPDSCPFDGEQYTSDSALQYRNTVGAYKAVVDGDADIIFCAAPSEQQKRYADENGVELVLVPIGYEAFVFFVNKGNPVDNLTSEQLRAIYSGEYTNWKEVGGTNRIINPIERPEGSGSQTRMLQFMDGRKIKKSPFAFLGASVGFSFRYYLDGIVDNEEIKMLSVDGVYPSKENISNGTYPLVSSFYAVFRADNDNENVVKLIDWVLSEEGQRIVNESGYVGIEVKE